MEIKEQIAKEIFEYDFTGFNPKWAECANKSHWLNLANKIIELFEQANPIQAGEDGLLADEEIQELYDSDDYGDGFALWKEIAIRQKALDDKEWEEKIKVIHSNIQKRLENGGSPIVVLATVKADIDSLLSQMKEGK